VTAPGSLIEATGGGLGARARHARAPQGLRLSSAVEPLSDDDGSAFAPDPHPVAAPFAGTINALLRRNARSGARFLRIERRSVIEGTRQYDAIAVAHDVGQHAAAPLNRLLDDRASAGDGTLASFNQLLSRSAVRTFVALRARARGAISPSSTLHRLGGSRASQGNRGSRSLPLREISRT
jgi:hypothetical protein